VGTPVIEVEGLRKAFVLKEGNFLARRETYLWAVDDVTFSIDQGETLGLVGESGCGKTTTAMMLLRMEHPTSGEIRYKGQDLSDLRGQALKVYRASVQAVLQDPWSSLSPRLRIGRIIAEPMLVHREGSRHDRSVRVEQLLEEVGLHRWQRELYPHEFSGGQRQRICIARALSVEPELIVLDEPVSALDVSVQSQIMNLLKDLQERVGVSYLLISHSLGTVRYLCRRVAVMYLGQIVELTDSRTLFRTPLHPYTRALIAASQPLGTAQDDAIRGEIPSTTAPPPGCRFNTRCPLATERCRIEAPKLRKVASGHEVRCHLA
jgi:oligopeptide transport system ATP-binding protein